jgi:hypothetical protein
MQIKDGFVLAINHEPLSFMRRGGSASVNEEMKFLDDHKEENIKKLAENGCNFIRMHFYKGFGLEAEKEEIEMTRDFVKLCHKYGVRVQLYTQFGTLFPETLLAEQPGMMDWIQTDADGKPVTLLYGHQSFRYYPCFNREGYWDYLEKVIELGINSIGADAIGFDNISTGEEPYACNCECCKKAFVKYLKDKYRPDTIEGEKLTKERFGFKILDYIKPPQWHYFMHPFNLTEIDDPVIQEWVLFRCESIQKVMKRLYGFCRKLNPDVLLEFNAYRGFGINTAFVFGLYVPDFTDCMDAFYDECDPIPEFTEDGRLLHKIRGYKMGQAMEKVVFSGHSYLAPEPSKLLSYAESMVFNKGIINGLDYASNIYMGHEKSHLKYLDFRRKHGEVYDSVSAANIALYESKTTLSYNNIAPWYANVTMQQGLLRGHIPYDIVFDLNTIGRYKAVVMPDVECLSDEEIASLKNYVENGGGLMITDRTGEYDNWRRLREEASLLKMLGIDKDTDSLVSISRSGKGRVAYVPRLVSDKVFNAEELYFKPFQYIRLMIGQEYWRKPMGLEEIINALKWASGDAIPFEIEAPEHVVVELQQNIQRKKLYMHLLNYKYGTAVKNIRIRFTSVNTEGCRDVRLLSPDTGAETVLMPESSGWITVPQLDCYSILSI